MSKKCCSSGSMFVQIMILVALAVGAYILIGKYGHSFFGFKSCGSCCNTVETVATEAAGNTTERTFALIKPDAVAAGKADEIIAKAEEAGFTVVKKDTKVLTAQEVEALYGIHKEKPFFNDLVAYVTSGPVVVLVLEKENAVQAWRDFMGATDPEKAEDNTLRKMYGTNLTQNAVHGSDSLENAAREIAVFNC